jgi:hypothetical protein
MRKRIEANQTDFQNITVVSDKRHRCFSFSLDNSVSPASFTSTPNKGNLDRRRCTLPQLFGTPGTISGIPPHSNLSSSFSEGDHYVEPLSLQYSPAEVAYDSGYYGTFLSTSKNQNVTLAADDVGKQWEKILSSTVQSLRSRFRSRPSFLNTSPSRGPLGKVTPQQILVCLILALLLVGSIFIFVSLHNFSKKVHRRNLTSGSKTGESSIAGPLSLNYHDGSKFKERKLVSSEDFIEYPDDPKFRKEERGNDGPTKIDTSLNGGAEVSISEELKRRRISRGEEKREKLLGRKRINTLQDSDVLRSNVLEERRKRMIEDRRNKMREEREALRIKFSDQRIGQK